MNFLTNLNLNKNEIQNAKLHNLATAPSSPVTGQVYYNTADNKFYGWDGTAWRHLGAEEYLTTAMITKLNGIATGAEVNQNAFSGIKVGGSTASAGAKTDSFEFVAGSNISLSLDTTNKKLTINNTYSYSHPNHTGDVTSTGDGVTVIGNNKVTDAKLRQSSALSIIGNATNATANVADITAGTDGHVLRRSGTTLGFGQIATGGITDKAVTLAKIQDISTATILGRTTAGTGAIETLTAAQIRTMLNVVDGANKVEASSTNGNIKVNGVETTVYTHPTGTNPHGTTKSDVGLGNVENKSSSTIRSEISSANVTAALGYTPIKNGGSVSEIKEGLESARPTATGSGILYLATDTGKIWKDVSTGTWKQMGGQDIPIASNSALGTIKVGANLTITEDGTLNANSNPAAFIRRQERFSISGAQTTFTLTKGTYAPGTGAIWWYLNGDRQDDQSLTEISPTSVAIPSGLTGDNEIMFEYFQVINITPFPNHANEHLTGGADAIPVATVSADGLMASSDKSKLNNATNANTGSTLVMRDASGNFSAGTITATLSGNASTATKLATARTISLTGDVTGSVSFDGSGNASITTTYKNSGVTAGTYTKVTVDAKGNVTSGTTMLASDIPTITLSKISDAGTAASKNTGTAEGNVPILGVGGKLDSSVLPAIAITDTFVVASQAAMLALSSAEIGDIAVRTDLNKSFILKANGYSTLANWQELLTPTDTVLSVAGKTGAVTLTSSDVGLGNVTNESKSTMFTSPSFTGTPVAPTATAGTNTTQIATTAFVKTAIDNHNGSSHIKKYASNIGDGAATTFTITHNLGTTDVTITLRESASPYEVVYTDIQVVDSNNIKVLFNAAPTSNQYRIVIVG